MKLLIATLSLLATGCKAEKAAEPDQTEAPDTAGEPRGTEPTKEPGPKLLDTAVERRLHVDRAEASSFLWNDWNRFQENYHPLYLADDDPATAWVEGASGSGAGEWIRLHVTEVAGATAVRLKLRNGYHKSKSLFAKNARAKKLAVKLLPSGKTRTFELGDSMETATLELAQPGGALAAVELKVVEVYEGSKYADLCLSDLEIHVTSRTPENPAFEKAKLERIRAWKKERLDAAALFASNAGKTVPVGTSYRVVDAAPLGEAVRDRDPVARATALASKAVAQIASHKAVLERARDGLTARFAGWKPASAAVKKGRAIPAIDGLHVPGLWELFGSGSRSDSYTLPLPGLLEYLTSSRVSLFESTEKVSVASALAGKPRACRREQAEGKQYYFRPPEGGAGGVTSEILVIQCGMVEERDGYYPYVAFQLLEYDETGKIAAIVESDAITAFSWTDGGKRLGSGKRVRRDGLKLIADRLIARK